MTTEAKHPIEIWSIDKILPYAQNAKVHSKDQVEKLAKLIKRFGWTQPIVVDKDGVIIAGHGRRLAAISLGREVVPVVCRRDLSKEEADALRLADNRVASNEYDTEALQQELARLAEGGLDMEMTGFDANELDFLTADLGAMDNEIFVEDIGEAVEEQRKGNAGKSKEVDESASPVVDALGFKRVTVTQSRELRGLMARVEAKTGLKGADALLKHLATTA